MTPQQWKSDRLYLRLLRESDVDERYMSWFEDKELIQFYSASAKTFSKDIVLKDILGARETNSLHIYGIFCSETDKCIGNIKIGPVHPIHQTSDLVVIIGDRDFHGKGLAIEAIKVGNEVAFDQHHVRKLFGGMFADNIPSIKAYLRAGWYVEGLRRGQYSVDKHNMDRILVACFNPKYFDMNKIKFELDEMTAQYI